MKLRLCRALVFVLAAVNGLHGAELTQAAVDKLAAETKAKIESHAAAKDYDAILEKLGTSTGMNFRYGAAAAQGQGNDMDLQLKIAAIHEYAIHWQDFQSAKEHGDLGKAAQLLATFAQQAEALYPIVPRSELLDAVQDANQSIADQHHALIKKASADLEKAVLSDSPLAAVAAVGDELDLPAGGNTYYDQNFNGSLQGIRQAISAWSNFFQALQTGTSQQINYAYERVMSSAAPTAAMREKAQKLLPEAKVPGVTIVVGPPLDPEGLSVSNLDKYRDSLSRQSNQGRSDGAQPQNTAAAIAQLIEARNRMTLGDTQAILEGYGFRFTDTGPYELPLEKVKKDLVAKALEIRFQSTGLLASPEEPNSAFIKRIILASLDKKQWQDALDAMVLGQSMSISRQDLGADISAVHSLINGIAEEKAEEYTLAARSYLDALQSAGTYAPTDELASRLKALKAAHPKDVADAEAQGRSTPADRMNALRMQAMMQPSAQTRPGGAPGIRLNAPPGFQFDPISHALVPAPMGTAAGTAPSVTTTSKQ